MAKYFRLFVLFALLLFCNSSFGQIKIKELPNSSSKILELDIINNNSFRETTLLDSGWKVFLPDNEEQKAEVKVPSIFTGATELVFRKNLNFTQDEIDSKNFRLIFLGVNYSAEVYLNGQVLYKSPAGTIPFAVEIPSEILTTSKNTLSVKVFYELDSEKTIPLKQTFQSPESFGGIFREVYLQKHPKVTVSKVNCISKLNNDLTNATIQIKSNLQKFLKPETEVNGNLNIQILAGNTIVAESQENNFSFGNKEEISLTRDLTVENPGLWFPNTPFSYTLKISLELGEVVTDLYLAKISIYSILNSKDIFKINNKPFTLKGTTYYPSSKKLGTLISYDQLLKDLVEIKNTGFNSVRFTKSVPHPAALEICRELGLLTFIELPINEVPEEIAEKPIFNERIERYLTFILDQYGHHSSVAAIGLGGSYLGNSLIHNNLLKRLSAKIKSNSDKLVYASFIDFPGQDIPNIDLFGLELYNESVEQFKKLYNKNSDSFGEGKLFISEATYPTFNGSTNGYKNDNSFEAQAKFFEELLNFTSKSKISGLFINTMFDYRSEFAQLSSGYFDENLCRIGIVDEDRENTRLAYKVIRAKLNKEEKVNIPMGYSSDDSPIFFILIGLAMAIILAILFNSKRKFREEATRALLRPYNFYADIRDQRILSGFHSNFLMIILAGSMALLAANILFFFRTNVAFEKIILSFGSHKLIEVVSYFAWNPFNAFLYFFIITILVVVVISFLIRIASMFVKTRVLFSSVYFTVTWSFLPLALILPLELVLYRILSANIINLYIYIFIILFTLWLIQRLLKGIYVIFDVRASKVYLFSFILFIVVIGGLTLYLQFSESTIYYLSSALKHISFN